MLCLVKDVLNQDSQLIIALLIDQQIFIIVACLWPHMIRFLSRIKNVSNLQIRAKWLDIMCFLNSPETLSCFRCKLFCNKGPYIYDVHTDGGWGSLEICHVFADSIVFKQ